MDCKEKNSQQKNANQTTVNAKINLNVNCLNVNLK